jgi:hypothetical protein
MRTLSHALPSRLVFPHLAASIGKYQARMSHFPVNTMRISKREVDLCTSVLRGLIKLTGGTDRTVGVGETMGTLRSLQGVGASVRILNKVRLIALGNPCDSDMLFVDFIKDVNRRAYSLPPGAGR